MSYLPSFIFSLFLSLVLLTACSNTPKENIPEHVKKLVNVTIHERTAQPEFKITLTKASVFKSSEKAIFGQLTTVDVDDLGTVYIVENSNVNKSIYVFDSNGAYKDRVGRTGRGPGEFMSLYDMNVSGNQIFTLDGILLRIQVFSTENYNLTHIAHLDPGQWDYSGDLTISFPDKFHVLNDSTILGAFNHTTFSVDTQSYYHLDMNGNVCSERLLSHDSIRHLKTRDGSHTFFDPFGGRGLMGVSTGNQLFTVWSEEMLFKVYDQAGTYLRAFYHPFENSEINYNEALSFYEGEPFKNALLHEGIPDYWRAFEHFVIDDENNLWVSTITDDREIYEWWIMDTYGNLRATYKWPRRKEIKKIKNGFAYTLETSEETGLQEVVKYDIRWSE